MQIRILKNSKNTTEIKIIVKLKKYYTKCFNFIRNRESNH